MLNCIAAIQFDEETQKFILVAGNNRLELKKTTAFKQFVENAPDISADVILGLSDVWFPVEDGIEEAEFENIKEETKDAT
jgi:hypothetical protein